MPKRVLVGVTGGIAAYKSAELIRRLQGRNCEVRVVMTPGACEFITPLTLETLSGHRVYTSVWDNDSAQTMDHIALARWADLVLVAPATANFLAKLAQGLADQLLTTLCLATKAPLFVAPAMNKAMWDNPATQANCQQLKQRGIHFLGPIEGEQACGDIGFGKMMEVDDVIAALPLQTSNLLENCSLVVTAGPTQEAIDPVRYITNRSSGKMGFAIAAAAAEAGARVCLIAGPVVLETPVGVRRVNVTSAAEMANAVEKELDDCAIFIAAAAVSDYAVRDVKSHKLKKTAQTLDLSLVPTIDIVASVTQRQNPPFTVGFAAETEQLEMYAKEKRIKKRLDLIAANWVGREDIGFESDYNELEVFWSDGHVKLEKTDKAKLATLLIELVAQKYHSHKES